MKIKVPEGMLEAAEKAANDSRGVGPEDLGVDVLKTLEAALRWLAENPVEPSDDQTAKLKLDYMMAEHNHPQLVKFSAVEWQRRMFLAPEPEVPEVPEAITDLIHKKLPETPEAVCQSVNAAILEAYQRGLKAGAK